MASSFVFRSISQEEAFADPSGQLILAVDRDGGRRVISLSLQITAFLEGREAVFWLKKKGPVKDERLAQFHRLVETDSGGFCFYEHEVLENLAFVAYRGGRSKWRFVAVADISGKRIEIDLEADVVPSIDWKVADWPRG